MFKNVSAALAAALVVISASAIYADALKPTKHHHKAHAAQSVAPASHFGGRLVTHPAWNIACQTRDRAIRALPCASVRPTGVGLREAM